MSKTFTRDELAAAFEKFEATVDRAAQTRDWDPWVEQYSPDVTYVEHAAGTMHGREEVRAWIWKTMGSFPGLLHDVVPVAVERGRRAHRPHHL
jgi:limonene-1,2-epoxide hydrolase